MTLMTGWKHAATDAPQTAARLRKLREQLPFELHEIIILGMGGSALAAYVLKSLYPCDVAIRVIDTTAPAYVERILNEMEAATTLLIVASKSGTTLEPNMLCRVFTERLIKRLGSAEEAAQHCVALTDPGTALEVLAHEEGWLSCVLTPPDVGGRYSALTAFGLAPLVLAGLEVERLIACAQKAESRAGGTRLANFLAEGAQAGRDVVLLALPAELTAVGRWLEQLIAESLGKEGRGLIPIVTTFERAEELLLFSPRVRTTTSIVTIGDDKSTPGADLSAGPLSRVRETARALDLPVCDYPLTEPSDVGAFFIDWEFAVAACGERLGINPFDQPDVAASKEATNRILSEGEVDHQEAEGTLLRPHDDLCAATGDPSAHYLALLAWLPYSKENDELLQRQARELEREYGLPVAVEYGPRYLHSTGQGYKGGPATGLFLFVDGFEAGDKTLRESFAPASVSSPPIPGEDFTLAQLFAAQRQGDISALAGKGRQLFRWTGPLS